MTSQTLDMIYLQSYKVIRKYDSLENPAVVASTDISKYELFKLKEDDGYVQKK